MAVVVVTAMVCDTVAEIVVMEGDIDPEILGVLGVVGVEVAAVELVMAVPVIVPEGLVFVVVVDVVVVEI